MNMPNSSKYWVYGMLWLLLAKSDQRDGSNHWALWFEIALCFGFFVASAISYVRNKDWRPARSRP